MTDFPFHPYLFESRGVLIEALDGQEILWFTHYSAIDVEHEIEGLHVTGMADEETASRVWLIASLTFPSWRHGRITNKDWGHADVGWRALLSQRCPQGPCACRLPKGAVPIVHGNGPGQSPGEPAPALHGLRHRNRARAPTILVHGSPGPEVQQVLAAGIEANALVTVTEDADEFRSALRKLAIAAVVISLETGQIVPEGLLRRIDEAAKGTIPIAIVTHGPLDLDHEVVLGGDGPRWLLVRPMSPALLAAQIVQMIRLYYQLRLVRMREAELEQRVTDMTRELHEQNLELRYKLGLRGGP